MIVLPAGDSLLLITQPDHAALARRVIERWKLPDLAHHPRLASLLYAIEHHDDGWLEVDAVPSIREDGQVADFVTAPLAVRQGVWPRCVSALSANPFAAALVAEHARYVYLGHRGKLEWSDFFAEMERLRSQYAAAAGVSLSELQQDYAFLRLGDLISLAFCNHWTEAKEDFHFTIRWRDNRVIVSPDPFGEAVV